ncbi:MAG: glycosyltransferase family 2 protein [Actinomycetota bacterium]|nr:glycosyltransferase family 2 protein [Actinomycetota bacterium]
MPEAKVPGITVLTPTYNRAHTLPRLHESLRAQSFSDFEWLIVDDGSEDDTETLVQSWIAAGDLEIRYQRQPNSGKHVAVNRGAELARAAYTTIVDSDDWLVSNSLERMLACWDGIEPERRPAFSGVVGLCAYENGRIIGDSYPTDPLDCDPVELSYLYRVTGDKHGTLRTDVLREFPFPFEESRGYVAESLVWNRMALRYVERHVNEVFLVKEYQEGGLTSRALELMIRAAPANRQFFLEEVRLPHKLARSKRVRSFANYIRFSFHSRAGLRSQLGAAPSKVAWAGLLPLGFGLYLRDRLRMARASHRTR